MNIKEAKLKLEALELIKIKGIGYHGYTWCDTPFYAELVAQMQECRDVIMVAEPSKVSEETFKSRW